ncbi:MAG: dienelactone hydrolase family protein [Pseudomonadales bacterium]
MAEFDRITLENGIVGEPLRVPTANPTSYYQAISKTDAVPAAEIRGTLFAPPGAGPWPVVIVVPGSLGVAPSHLYKADLLTAAGIATCVIDPFGERGVTSTVADQTQYSFAASAWDVLAAAAVLGRRDDVVATRIGAQGHSRGGSAVLSAACMAQRMALPEAAPLQGVYAAYPWCGHQFLHPRVGDTVVRAVIGDRDEWCLPQQVQAQIQAMALCGGRASCRIFPGAQHSFDRDTPVEMIEEAAVAPGAPTVYLRDDGAFIHPLQDEADPSLTERELMIYGMKAGYGLRGARIGSEPGQADAFHEDMLEFWTAVFRDPNA